MVLCAPRASAEAEPGSDDRGAGGSPWGGDPLPGRRRGPAALEARVSCPRLFTPVRLPPHRGGAAAAARRQPAEVRGSGGAVVGRDGVPGIAGALAHRHPPAHAPSPPCPRGQGGPVPGGGGRVDPTGPGPAHGWPGGGSVGWRGALGEGAGPGREGDTPRRLRPKPGGHPPARRGGPPPRGAPSSRMVITHTHGLLYQRRASRPSRFYRNYRP